MKSEEEEPRIPGSKALKVKLDLLERQDGGAPREFGVDLGRRSVSSAGGSQKEEGSGSKRVGRHAGVFVVPVERDGCGHG